MDYDLCQWRCVEFRYTTKGRKLPEDCVDAILDHLFVYEQGPICVLCRSRECQPEEHTSGLGAICSRCWGVL